MLLYHYSKKPFKKLLTLELQGKVDNHSRKEGIEIARFRKDPGPYYQHLSFLLEPAPIDILSDIFPKDHHTWTHGQVLYEHVVDVDSLKIYAWKIAETAINTIMGDYFWIDNDSYKKWYFTVRHAVLTLTGSRGVDHKSMCTAIGYYRKGITRDSYIKYKTSKNYENSKYQYAPNVPHLMAYTTEPVPIVKINKVVVGGKPTMESWYDW